eukprot:scaffold15328_cov16-Prasinocladus_malaysianus.AAC.4
MVCNKDVMSVMSHCKEHTDENWDCWLRQSLYVWVLPSNSQSLDTTMRLMVAVEGSMQTKTQFDDIDSHTKTTW